MAKVNGKNKGNSFERKIANLLSERFEPVTGVKTGFRRNPDSGAFFGGSNVTRTQTHNLEHANFGDIICPEDFAFNIECKHYKDAPTFAAITKGKVTQWDSWLTQASQDARSSSKKVFLLIKYNNIDEVVFVEEEIPNCTKVLAYKQYHLYKLDEILANDNTLFFNSLMAQ